VISSTDNPIQNKNKCPNKYSPKWLRLKYVNGLVKLLLKLQTKSFYFLPALESFDPPGRLLECRLISFPPLL
jgi:hypothetical protein